MLCCRRLIGVAVLLCWIVVTIVLILKLCESLADECLEVGARTFEEGIDVNFRMLLLKFVELFETLLGGFFV